MKPMKKQSFLQGAGILAFATIAVKIIGALYKIPLNNIIGKTGMTYFTHAYDIYALLLIISTAGLPVAMSRMIAKAQEEGNLAQVRRINSVSLRVFLTLGITGTLVMMLLCKPLASMMGISDGSIVIFALGPAVLFVCINSSFRGFFQGQTIMTPTGVSQVIEAACKLVLGLALALLLIKITDNVVNSVAGAILGVTIGSVLAFFYLIWQYNRYKPLLNDHNASKPSASMRNTAMELLQIAIPITIGSAGLQAISLIDDALIIHRLTDAAEFTAQAATDIRGLYATAQTLFNLPGSLVIPFTTSLIPAITGALARRDRRGANRIGSSGIRIMTLLILPCGVGLGVLAKPIVNLLYGSYTEADVATTGTLLAILSVAVILNGLVLMLNSIMQAHGYVSLPVINMIVGGVFKVFINFILVGIPSIHIYGAPIGTTTCFLIITALDIFCINRVIKDPPKVLKLLVKPIIACAAMGVATYLCYAALAGLLGAKLACVAAICVAVAVYGIMVVVLRIVTWDDCMLLPKGEKIAKLLRIHK